MLIKNAVFYLVKFPKSQMNQVNYFFNGFPFDFCQNPISNSEYQSTIHDVVRGFRLILHHRALLNKLLGSYLPRHSH